MKVTQANSFLEGWGLLLFSKLVLTLSPVFVCNSFSVPSHPSEDMGSKVFARTLEVDSMPQRVVGLKYGRYLFYKTVSVPHPGRKRICHYSEKGLSSSARVTISLFSPLGKSIRSFPSSYTNQSALLLLNIRFLLVSTHSFSCVS